VVQVFFCGTNGFTRSFLYSLIAEGDSWKINDVRPMPTRSRPAGLNI